MTMQPALPNLPLQYEEYQLGSLVETYQTQVTRSGRWVFSALILTMILFVGVFIGFFFWLVLPSLNDPLLSSPLFFLTSFIASALSVLVMFALAFWQFRSHDLVVTPIRRKIIILLYQKGFIYREGRTQHIVTWEQIRFIERLSIKRWNMPLQHYKLSLEDTTQISLTVAIADVQKLGTAIEQAIVKRLLPGVLVDYAAQKPIVFLGLCLNQSMVSKSDEGLLWPEVDQIVFGIEKFMIKERWVAKDWLTISISQLRNICVLEALLEHISKEKGFRLVRDHAGQTRKAGRTMKVSQERMG